jgi:hypothetical protein
LIGGASLFLVVTFLWIIGLVAAELGSIASGDLFVALVAALSAASLAATGYLLGRWEYSLAAWWFVASIFGPAALLVVLPPFRGLRHRSVGWIATEG